MGNNAEKEKTRGQRVLETLLGDTGLTATAFAEHIGVAPSVIQDISRGRTMRFSKRVADAVLACYPEYDKFYLLSGEGEKYKIYDEVYRCEINNGKNIATGAGSSAGDGFPSDIINRLLDELSAQRKQNQELIEILKNKIK